MTSHSSIHTIYHRQEDPKSCTKQHTIRKLLQQQQTYHIYTHAQLSKNIPILLPNIFNQVNREQVQ
jgi:hypothetical protein